MACILLVDDDALVLRSLATMLQRAGYEVRAVTSAVDALAEPELASFGLVISDVDMPHMSGIELAQALQGRQLQIPIVLISAHPLVYIRPEAEQCQLVRHLLQKPFPLRDFIEIVRSILPA